MKFVGFLVISIVFITYTCDRVAANPAKLLRKLEVEISPNMREQKSAQYRIIITSNPAAVGKAQAAKRLAAAASRLGWEWAIIDRLDQQPGYLSSLKPDFVLSLREEILPFSEVPHFLYLHVPMFMYLNKDGSLCTKAYPNVLKYDGFLQVVPDLKPVREAYAAIHQKKFYSVKTVFSVPATKFKITPKARLCYWGSTWDKARGETYQSFYELLDKTDYFDLYGPEFSWKKRNFKSYRGTLPLDDHSIVDAISVCGIALVLHSHEHIRGRVPTARIFEAAAASAVIICDEHPFVKEHFGDAVLYINPNKASRDVFQQIDQHVKWIQQHPFKAIELAKKAHEIFIKHFSLEGELAKIAHLYEEMQQEPKR